MFESLVEFVTSNGGSLRGIEPALTEEGWRGVVATEDIACDQIILQIPEDLLMSTRSAHACPRLGPVLARHPTLSDKQVLCTHLLHEMAHKDTSRFRVYLEHLPRSYNLLESWESADARRLGVQTAEDECKEAIQALETEWAQCRDVLREALPGPASARWRSKAAWTWASGSVMSRTMYAPWDTVGCLTPLGDFHNYRPPPAPFTGFVEASLFPEENPAPSPEAPAEGPAAIDPAASPSGQTSAEESEPEPSTADVDRRDHTESSTSDAAALSIDVQPPASEAREVADPPGISHEGWGDGAYCAATRMYHVTARRRYKTGEQVFLCYGKYTNLELLRTYGFLLDGGNAHDHVPVPSEPHLRRAAPRHAREFLETQAPEDLHITSDGEPSWHLLQALRALTCDPVTWRRNHRSFSEGRRFSLEGDVRALERLIEVAADLFGEVREPGPEASGSESGENGQVGNMPAAGTAASSGSGALSLAGGGNAALADQWREGYKAALRRCVQKANERLTRLRAQLSDGNINASGRGPIATN